MLLVPVPRRHYSAVITFLARLMGGDGTGTGLEPDWSEEMIRTLHAIPLSETVRALMDLTCARPGERVTFDEVRRRSGRAYPNARADLAGFTRALRATFGRADWPVRVIAGGAKGTLQYEAEPAIARAWRDASKTPRKRT